MALKILQIFLIVLLFTIYSDASYLQQILKFMEKYEEILIVSDQISNLKIKGNATVTSPQFQLSFANTTLNSDQILSQVENISSTLLKVIANLKTVQETVQFISQAHNFQNDVVSIWILILWPETIKASATNLNLQITNINLVSLILQKYLESTSFITKINIMSQFYVAFPKENILEETIVSSPHELFSFYEVYGLNEQLLTNEVSELGTVFPSCRSCIAQSSRRSNLQGISFRAEGLEDPEFQNDTDYYLDKNGEIKLIKGFSVDIYKILEKSLNFTSTVTIMNSTMSKEMNESSSWDGVIQRVEQGEVDVGLSLTVQLVNRAQRVSFLPPTDEYIVSAFFKPPSANAVRDIFMQPFKSDLWAAVFATWIILASSMILFTVIRKRAGIVSECGPDQVEPDFTQNSFIWALATACQQGWDEHPVAGSLRTIFISGSFTGVVAYAGYSAAIVSTLSLKIDPIQTPDALVKSNLDIGVRVGFLDKILATDRSSEDIVSRIYGRLTKTRGQGLVNVTTGFHLLNSYSYAFISIRDTFYDTVTQFQNDKEICEIRDLEILKHGFPAGAFLSYTSPYKEYFRVVLTKIRERGVLWRLRVFYLYKRRCATSTDSQGQILGPNDVFTAFMILVAAKAASLAILLMERFYFRRVKAQVTW